MLTDKEANKTIFAPCYLYEEEGDKYMVAFPADQDNFTYDMEAKDVDEQLHQALLMSNSTKKWKLHVYKVAGSELVRVFQEGRGRAAFAFDAKPPYKCEVSNDFVSRI